jgi:hypothetical protein
LCSADRQEIAVFDTIASMLLAPALMPEFGGPAGQGASSESKLPVHWSPQASMAISGGAIYILREKHICSVR